MTDSSPTITAETIYFGSRQDQNGKQKYPPVGFLRNVCIRMLRRISLDFILLTFETRCFILFFEKSGECICEVLEGGLKDGAIYLLDRAVPFLTVAVEPHRRSLPQQERMFYKNIEKFN